jgi:hypothetical protein
MIPLAAPRRRWFHQYAVVVTVLETGSEYPIAYTVTKIGAAKFQHDFMCLGAGAMFGAVCPMRTDIVPLNS